MIHIIILRLYQLSYWRRKMAVIKFSFQIVIEPSPIRSLAADYQIHIVFQHSHFGIFHPYVVANMTPMGFQHF